MGVDVGAYPRGSAARNAILDAGAKLPEYRVVRLDVADGHQVRVLDDGTRKQTVIAGRFGGLHALDTAAARPQVSRFKPESLYRFLLGFIAPRRKGHPVSVGNDVVVVTAPPQEAGAAP
jgi:hypothetical protein